MSTNNWEPTGENVLAGTTPTPVAPTNLNWSKVGSIRGPEGDPGADSTVPGPPNVLTVGSVSTGDPGTPVAVEITGTSPNQQVHFTIPRGADGYVGADGRSAYEVAQANGFAGTEPEWLDSLIGESAYEVAVRLGYTGTEPEWLASLKGDKGDQGDPGDKGDPGSQGDPGPLNVLAQDGANGYPARPAIGVPMIFVGPDQPGTVPGETMIDDDVWLNNATPGTPATYIDQTNLDPSSASLVNTSGSQLRAAVKSVADASAAAVKITPWYGPAWPIDTVPSTPNPMDDEFTGTTLDPKWTITSGSTAVPTVAVEDGMCIFTTAITSGWVVQAATQPLPATGDWEFVLAVAGIEAAAFNYHVPAMLGIAEFTTGTNGRVHNLMMADYAASNYAIETGYLTSWTAWVGGLPVHTNAHVGSGYLRIGKVGSTYSFAYSRSGKRWRTLYSTNNLGYQPGRVLIGGKTESTSAAGTEPVGLFKWFRRTA